MIKIPRDLASTLLCLVPIACGPSESPVAGTEKSPPGEKLSVYTVNYPLAYFAERIGGDLVEVSFPAPADADPANWSPDAGTVAAYQAADLILLNGAGYARWTARASLPLSTLVDTLLGKSRGSDLLESRICHLVNGHEPLVLEPTTVNLRR